MKIINNIKSKLVYSFFISGMVFLTTSCSDNKTDDSKEVAQQENMAKMDTTGQAIVVVENDDYTKFLMDAAEIQLEEISLGKLAQQKGNSPHVKELGRMMEEGHTKTLDELKILAQSKSVSIPASITEDSKDAYEKLEKKSGNDFGIAYSQMMVEHHKDAIKLFEKASTESEDPDIRNWASMKLPSLRTHLKHAEECKIECDKMKS